MFVIKAEIARRKAWLVTGTLMLATVPARAHECNAELNPGIAGSAMRIRSDQAQEEHVRGNFVRAETLCRSVAAELQASETPDFAQLGLVLGRLASVRHDQGAYHDAELLSRQSQSHLAATFGVTHSV